MDDHAQHLRICPGNVKISANIHHTIMTWFAVGVGTIVLLALASYVSFLAARYFFVPRFPDEIQFGTTSDGWRIAVLRYRPDKPSPHPPALLVHGIAANRYNLDLTDETSLAKHLQGRGFDVFVVELRGRGFSLRPKLFSGLRYDWSFDDYAERDLPCAADIVMRATGATALHLVGFSTGALAAYAWLSDPHRSVEVASLVSIGGAASFKRLGKVLSGRLIRSFRFLRHRWILRVLAPISGYWHPSPLHPATDHGQHDRQLLAQRAAPVQRLDPQRRLPVHRSATRLSCRAVADHRPVAVPGGAARCALFTRRGQGHPRRHRRDRQAIRPVLAGTGHAGQLRTLRSGSGARGERGALPDRQRLARLSGPGPRRSRTSSRSRRRTARTRRRRRPRA
jgi:alpha-beta hydrolase superfamily lysophospholipase